MRLSTHLCLVVFPVSSASVELGSQQVEDLSVSPRHFELDGRLHCTKVKSENNGDHQGILTLHNKSELYESGWHVG